jgi:hypothetical protein
MGLSEILDPKYRITHSDINSGNPKSLTQTRRGSSLEGTTVHVARNASHRWILELTARIHRAGFSFAAF